MSTRGRSRGAAAAAVALVVTLVAGGTAYAAPAPDFPTWEEVEAARSNEAETARTVARLEALLTELSAEAESLGRIAQQRAEEASVARDAAEAATARAERFTADAESAELRASDSTRRAALIVNQVARTGGGDPTLALMFGSSVETDELLAALSSMTRMSMTTSALLERAVIDRNTATALSEQALVAEELRLELAGAAESSLAEATAALAAAEDRVTAQRSETERVYAQLASLRGTTSDLERAYQEGLAWEEVQASQPDPPVAPPLDPDPPAPVPDKVAGAIAFAMAQVGKPYGWAGAGPDVWDCSGLVLKSYAAVGVAIGPHGSTSQYNTLSASGRLVTIQQLQAGDLLFYSDGGTTSGTKYHVTMYLGNDQMIEAPYPGQFVRVVPIRYGDLVPYAGRPTA